ncbi:MAG: hypothetical protein ACFB6R_05695 [Alphaproteobacteria bacterium]
MIDRNSAHAAAFALALAALGGLLPLVGPAGPMVPPALAAPPNETARTDGVEAAPPPLTAAQATIFETVLQSDGFITEDLHKAFWADFRKKRRSGADSSTWLAAELEASVAIGLQFQREAWRSARESLRAGTIVTTPHFEGTRRDAEALIRATQARGAVQSARLASALEAADALLAAAATGTDLRLGNTVIPLTEDRISSVLSGLDAAAARADQLLTPAWSAPAWDQIFRTPGVALRWPTPFTVEVRRRDGPEGRALASWTLTARSGLRDFAFVTVIDLSGPWRDAETGLTRLARQVLSSAGIEPAAISSEPWQTRAGAVGSGERRIGEAKRPKAQRDGAPSTVAPAAYAAVRVVDVPERQQAVALMILTAKSAKRSRARLDALSQALQVLDGP